MSQYVTLKLKRGTSTEWSTTNPTLAVGEPGFETDSGKMKIGDGIATWANLPYVTAKTNPLTDSVSLGVDTVGQGIQSVAIGHLSGQTNQGQNSVAIGDGAGEHSQSFGSIAVGYVAGQTGQQTNSIAIGSRAGQTGQQMSSVAIGFQAGSANQGNNSVAIGYLAGEIGQQTSTVAIGTYAGRISQGLESVAIGNQAGTSSQPANTIILNASGVALNGNAGVTGCFYVKPIRSITGASTGNTFYAVSYNPVTGELTIP